MIAVKTNVFEGGKTVIEFMAYFWGVKVEIRIKIERMRKRKEMKTNFRIGIPLQILWYSTGNVLYTWTFIENEWKYKRK